MPPSLRELRIAFAEASYWSQRLVAFGVGLIWDEWDKLQIRRASHSQSARAHQPDDQWFPLPCRCASCCERRKSVVA